MTVFLKILNDYIPYEVESPQPEIRIIVNKRMSVGAITGDVEALNEKPYYVLVFERTDTPNIYELVDIEC